MEAVEQSEARTGVSHQKPWLIVLLALLFSSFVFVYCGRLRRAVVWNLLLWTFLCPIAASIMLYVRNGKVAIYGGMLVIFFAIVAQIVDALLIGKQQRGEAWRPYQRWWGYFGLMLAFVVFNNFAAQTMKLYWVEAFHLPSSEMRETLLPGDRFLVNKLSIGNPTLERGQVVVFRAPKEHDDRILVKRLIALPGDAIRIEQGMVYVNDELLEEPYARFVGPAPSDFGAQHFLQRQVPENCFFALGDNRWQSYDSRFFGFVPMNNFVGKAAVVFWSREYEYVSPTRQNPVGREVLGDMRWDRFGRRIR